MVRSSRVIRVALALVLVSLTHATGDAQQRAARPESPGSGWVVPRTADGRPDLQGVWENNSATPLERPRQLADKPRLSDAELESFKRRSVTLFGPEQDAIFGDALYLALLANTTPPGLGATGSYSQNWLPDRYFEHRTSLIIDPADGKLPPPTPAGAKLRAAAAGRFGRVGASAQEMSLQDRCIHYGFPDLFAAYMAVYRIVQSPEYVAIQMEKIHDARIIPLDGRPHASSALRQYLGDSRGRWEGDTLVVETTNFSPKARGFRGGSENMKVTERFSRNADGNVIYNFKVEDPTVWVAPWGGEYVWRSSAERMFEYACHEGNYALGNIMRGARLLEQDAMAAKK
jgi:hypothetical protein